MPGRGSRRSDNQKQPVHEEFERHGRHVVITGEGDTATLLIDGSPQRFYVSDKGFVLHAEAYRPPAPSLKEAVEAYLDRVAENDPGGASS